jgi:hypothetical protein
MDRPRAHASHAAGSGIETSPEAATPQWIWAAKRATVTIQIVFPVASWQRVRRYLVAQADATRLAHARIFRFHEGNKALAGLLKRKVPWKLRPANGRLF